MPKYSSSDEDFLAGVRGAASYQPAWDAAMERLGRAPSGLPNFWFLPDEVHASTRTHAGAKKALEDHKAALHQKLRDLQFRRSSTSYSKADARPYFKQYTQDFARTEAALEHLRRNPSPPQNLEDLREHAVKLARDRNEETPKKQEQAPTPEIP